MTRKKLDEMGEKLFRYTENGYTTCTTEPVCDGHPYGIYFTPDELRELVTNAVHGFQAFVWQNFTDTGDVDQKGDLIERFLKDEGL